MKAKAIDPDELFENDWLFFELLFAAMPHTRPAKELADFLGLSENTTIKWGREPLSDEAPMATGARNPANRFKIIWRYFALRYNRELARAWIAGMQRELDRCNAELAQDALSEISDPEIRAAALRDIQKKGKGLVMKGQQPK